MPQSCRIRPAGDADLPAMLAIYEPEVRHGTATFEIEPPDLLEFGQRLRRLDQRGLPWLVAEGAEGVLAYAYAAPYHQRPAYGLTVEDSIYVEPAARGRGVGRSLLGAVIAAAAARGMRQMVALIGDSANVGSIRIHEARGFAAVGTLRQVGRKFDRWLDVVIMQRAL
jgi:phosphinothricin acetyltransferase